MKEASIRKVSNKYELVYWILSLPRRTDALMIADLIEEAKESTHILWSHKDGIILWKVI